MRVLIHIILYQLLLSSCIYKAGNRQPDLNQRYDITISPYYVKKYMKTIDLFYANRMNITSEIVNFPEDFIPVTDTLHGFKYVIEFYDLDSVNYIESHYLNLASLYDFKRKHWIKDRDSLKNGELEKFRQFFKDSVLAKVVERYQNQVPDSLLFTEKSHIISIKELQ